MSAGAAFQVEGPRAKALRRDLAWLIGGNSKETHVAGEE